MNGAVTLAWGFTQSEASIRLREELTRVPTRKNSIRFISTYAGFENEIQLLWDPKWDPRACMELGREGEVKEPPSSVIASRDRPNQVGLFYKSWERINSRTGQTHN